MQITPNALPVYICQQDTKITVPLLKKVRVLYIISRSNNI